MSSFANSLQQLAVTGVALAVAAPRVAGLQQRLKIVQYQQTRPLLQQLQQDPQLCAFAFWSDYLLARQKANRPSHPFANRRCVPKTAPIQPLEIGRDVLGQPC